MEIQMTQTRRGSENGFVLRVFESGKIYPDVADTLARYFVRTGSAIKVGEK